MLKNFALAVLIAIVLTYSFGHVITEWFDVHLSMANHHLESGSAVLAFTGLAVVLVIIGFVIAASIVAAVGFILVAVAMGVFVAGISVFWPVILFALIIFLLVRDNKSQAY